MSLFEPLELQFRAPSEHTVDGTQYDVELQIIHQYKGTNGQMGAAIGIFFDREAGGNRDNPFIHQMSIDQALAYSPGDPLAEPEPIPPVFGFPLVNAMLASFLSSIDMKNYWSYPGSLTTPPCTEGVKWTILEEVQSISDE